jgi:flagellar basal-body rod protein FlgC
MGLFNSLEVSATALTAERLRMDVTAENLANAQTTRGANGQAYRRKTVILQETAPSGGFGAALNVAMGGRAAGGAPAGAPGVEVAQIAEDPTPGRRIYDPGHPDADAQGYVTMPNVDTVAEMVDLISASRAYEANVTAMQAAKSMFAKTLDILR